MAESKRVQLLDLGIEWTGEFVRRIGVLPAFVRSLACFRALAERLQSARGPPLSAVSARFRRVRSRSRFALLRARGFSARSQSDSRLRERGFSPHKKMDGEVLTVESADRDGTPAIQMCDSADPSDGSLRVAAL